MFSFVQKQEIAKRIEELLLSFHHPEMAKEKPYFKIHIDGAEGWSWADIEPNWIYEKKQPPSFKKYLDLPFEEKKRIFDNNMKKK